MRQFLIKVGVNAVSLWVASLVVPDVGITGSRIDNHIATFVILGLLFGLVNAYIKPIVDFFAFPLKILTLGLFAFVVNALMLKVLEWLSGLVGLGFTAGRFFWATLAAAVVTTFVSVILHMALPDAPRRD